MPADLLVFEVSGRRFALPLRDVREIVRAVAVESLPRGPAIVEGVINARGALVPVLDLRSRFGLIEKPLDPLDHFVLASAGERTVAIRADRALDVIHLPPGAIEDATAIVPGAQYVAGVARLPDGLLLIHDLRTFLSRAEADALDRSLADGGSSGG